MTDPVSDCPTHGFYAHATGDGCPGCAVVGEQVLDGHYRKQLSTFCSGALRHFPDDVGHRLDAAGWVSWDDVVATVERTYDWAGEREVRAVVVTDPKGRFETRERDEQGRTIRAAYGHSVAVDLDHDRDPDDGGTTGTSDDVPETLYHGTAPRNLDAILDEGLKPMSRQAVHLSGDSETARTVGQRHTDDEPVILVVDVRGLTAAGFDVRKRGQDTYTVDHVPPAFLSRRRPE